MSDSKILRTAILDVLCGDPPESIGLRLRRALNESRAPTEHPEDHCEECRSAFGPWTADPVEWCAVTGRAWGGPIFCRDCFGARLAAAEEAARVEWRKIPGVDERYEVSRDGRVRSWKQWHNRPVPRELVGAVNSAGHQIVQFGRATQRRTVHDLVSIAFPPVESADTPATPPQTGEDR